MTVDALADRLSEILSEGSVVASALSRPMRRAMEPLFWSGALREEKAGAGKRVVLIDRRSVEQWVLSRYPSGLNNLDLTLPARAAAVATFRDSKAGARLEARPVFMRGFRDARLERAGQALPVGELTAAHGLAGVLLDSSAPWSYAGTLVLVENFEVFLHIERVIPDVLLALWTSGRLDHRVINWLASMPDARIVHAGDYDPVGIDEYLRVAAALPGRVRLYVPPDFEARLVRFGSGELLAKSSAVLERVRANGDAATKAVLAVMDRHSRALEQEALLVPMPVHTDQDAPAGIGAALGSDG